LFTISQIYDERANLNIATNADYVTKLINALRKRRGGQTINC